ncbi:DUF4160 domain-containing protein [Pseudomonas turukhanskensis]|uniref:DUF4160 domain-containing protein n=1 Tax=Pseudomonas turukhanskensis TaxID=1806536 RepID=A0A9W6K4H4_9PSED|nr:DUF4160 domain-containing protein [Pseudomonas turukhanskensis]GLK87334.1 hypothetical protein GCM10017655_03960 [Pseudomonas turukhanskensis]
MATLISTGAWKIKIYPNDHPPPHFHLQTADGESLVEILPLRVSRNGANKRAQKEALEWALHHQPLLSRVWDEQNHRSDA